MQCLYCELTMRYKCQNYILARDAAVFNPSGKGNNFSGVNSVERKVKPISLKALWRTQQHTS